MAEMGWPVLALLLGAGLTSGLTLLGWTGLSQRLGVGAVGLSLLAGVAELAVGGSAPGSAETWPLAVPLAADLGYRLDPLATWLVVFGLGLATVSVGPLLFRSGAATAGLAAWRWPATLLLLASVVGLLLTSNPLVLVALWGLSAALVTLCVLISGYPWALSLRLLGASYLSTLLLAWAFVWLLRTNGGGQGLSDLSWSGVPTWVGIALGLALVARLGLFPFHGWIGPLASAHRSLAPVAIVTGVFIPSIYLSMRLLGLAQPPALDGLRVVLQVLALISMPLLGLHALRVAEPTRAASLLLVLAGAGAMAGLSTVSAAGALAGLFFALTGPLAFVAWLQARAPRPSGALGGRRWARLAPRAGRALSALSLAGLPLTGGFVAFWLLHTALAERGQWLGLGASLSGHLLALAAGIRLAWLGGGLTGGPSAMGDALAAQARAAAVAALGLVLVAIGVVPRAGMPEPLLAAVGEVARMGPANLGLVPRGLLTLEGGWFPVDVLVWTILAGAACLVGWRLVRAGAAPLKRPERPVANLAEEFIAPLHSVLERVAGLAEGAGAPRLLARGATLAASLVWRGFAAAEGRYAVPAMILAALALLLVLGR